MRRLATLIVLTLAVAACGQADPAPDLESAQGVSQEGQPSRTVLVYKTPSCGCCNGWVEHMEAAGFTVDARNVTDIMSVKLDAGVPTPMSSCHTALIDGYVVEGHVPAEQVERLLVERPEVAGIAVPGMPIGSPGMEGPNAKPYQVYSFDADGSTAVYAEIDPR